MAERLLGGHRREALAGAPEEGAAGAREPDAPELAFAASHQALVDGRVLGVHRYEAAGLGHGHEEVAGGHEGLLVGAGEHLARGQGGVGGVDAGLPHHGHEDAVHVVQGGELHDPLVAEEQAAARRQAVEDAVVAVGAVGHGHGRGTELPGQGHELRGAAVHRERRHLHAFRVLPRDVEGLSADGARAAQDGHTQWRGAGRRGRAVLEDVHRSPPSLRMKKAVMEPKRMESVRSSMPP